MSLGLRLVNLPRFVLGAWRIHRGDPRYPRPIITLEG